MSPTRDAGTAIPLVLLCFLLAGTLVTASIAASAAFLAQRDLAGVCDGAAVAAAAGAVDRAALDRISAGGPGSDGRETGGPGSDGRETGGRDTGGRGTGGPGSDGRETGGRDTDSPDTGGHGPGPRAAGADTDAAEAVLPVDPAAVTAAVERYRDRAGRDGLVLTASTDGRTVTVTCRRTVRIPFGAVLGRADGLDRIAVAHARSPLLPAG